MRHAVLPFLAGLLCVPRASRAQDIPRTVAAAEAEGAAFRREAAPTLVPAMFGGIPYEGSNDRRCVTRAPNDSVPSGSLRSGELIVRTGFTGRWGLRADKPSKVVWFPLVPFRTRGSGIFATDSSRPHRRSGRYASPDGPRGDSRKLPELGAFPGARPMAGRRYHRRRLGLFRAHRCRSKNSRR